MTRLADFSTIKTDLFGDALRGFVQIERQRTLNVGSLLNTNPAASAAEHVAEPEHIPKDVENIADVVETMTAALVFEPALAVSIINLSFIRIAQNFKSLCADLKFGNRFFIAGIPVWMIFESRFAICRFNFILRGGTLNSQ